MDSPGLFTVTSEHIPFLLFIFFCYYTFYLLFPCGRLSWLMSAYGFRARVKIASRIVSYRMECGCVCQSKTLGVNDDAKTVSVKWTRLSRWYDGDNSNVLQWQSALHPAAHDCTQLPIKAGWGQWCIAGYTRLYGVYQPPGFFLTAYTHLSDHK